MVNISDAAFALIVAEGQLENAIREARRWRLRKQEAEEMELNAQDRIKRFKGYVESLRTNIGNTRYVY